MEQVENHYVENSIPESDLSHPHDSQKEFPIPLVGDSEVFLLPYEEMNFVASNNLEVTSKSPDLVKVDTNDSLDKRLHVSASLVMGPEPFDGFGKMLDEDDICCSERWIKRG